VIDERERGNELAIFREVAFQCGRDVGRADAFLEFGSPVGKLALPMIVKAEKRQRFELIALRPDGVNVQAFEAVERPPGGLSRRRVRPAVALFPVTLIRPDQEAEPLNQTVVAGAALDRASHVFGEPARLRRAQQREVVATAARLKAPLAHTSRGKDFLEYDNPYNVGMTGILGARAGYHAILDCDVLLLLGADFAWRQFYPDSATIIQIESASDAHRAAASGDDRGRR
jgi:hypothetical protein